MEPQTVKTKSKKTDNSSFILGLIIGILVTVLLVALVILGVILFGKSNGLSQGSAEKKKLEKLLEDNDLVDEQMLQKLSSIEDVIDKYYYKDDLDDEVLSEGIYRGILDAVGDPYTCYFSEEELEEMLESSEGVYYGIGAYVTLDQSGMYPMITAPIAGSPAEEADLRPGDIVYEINGEPTYGKSLDAAVTMMRGKEGTEVEVTILRSTESEYIHLTLVRRRVEAPTVTYEMLEDNIGYIQITQFSEVTVDQFADALASVRASGMEGLIIDLRANPGGSLTSVIGIGRMLLPEGLIMYTEDKYGDRDEYKCDGKREFDKPLVVLVDGNSASASEVLAGAIKDYELGTLVGTTTFGKGIVQTILPLNDGSGIKITTSSYYSPKGTNIHGTGIEPDVVCEFDSEAYYGEEEFDNQLDCAKEVLKDMME
ncbi:MAG: PDZ domain-containing protein [Lachnospiraceae bacterium]|nr:PDZ domain-containing protein [Lachnospiraceae bacterium]